MRSVKITQLFVLLLVAIFSNIISLHAQVATKWIEKNRISIDSTEIWTIDVFDNLYFTKKDLIYKYDSTGTLKFSQSQKSIGRLSSIHPINSMKLLEFSEEQQLFCFLDNTLTAYESCVNLMDFQIDYASKVSVSAQPDKCWVLDQINSRLHLLSLKNKSQSQIIGNINGLLNTEQIIKIVEHNNQVYLLDSVQGIFILDIYGSLVNKIAKKQVKDLLVDNENLYLLTNDSLVILHLPTNQEMTIAFPNEGIFEFQKNEKHIYFRTKNEIIKYKLLFIE